MADAQATSSNGNGSANAQFTAPQISAPKGGGAIRGIGEKFSASAVTGTGSLSIPIAMSPGRGGFDPQIGLHYDSGSGNGSFGLGWTIATPNITRKTAKGLPRYRDERLRDAAESEVFILSGAEDLVPVLDEESHEVDGYRIDWYRPRVEALFARIERWTHLEDASVHWRSYSASNVLTIYGDSPECRIADPENPRHIFSWLLSSTYDDRGNAMVYRYAAENERGVDVQATSERDRSRSANRYLKRVLYGNRTPMRGEAIEDAADFMFEVVLDYGEEEYRESTGTEGAAVTVEVGGEASGEWLCRLDPFSTYRSGFEVRTYRLCRRILVFHRFPEELGTERCLVRSTEFGYCEKTTGSLLQTATQSGYRRLAGNRYLKKSLPPLELEYAASPLESEALPHFAWREAEHENLPGGVDGRNYRWVDLDGEGIPGVLTEQDGAWYYKHNLGHSRFGAVQSVAQIPSLADIQSDHQQLLDIDGGGSLNLVELAPQAPGFFERTRADGWGQFRSFRSFPVLDWSDPNLRFVDVTGDGIADILITEDAALRWHPSLLKAGFGAGVRVAAPGDERQGPRVVFADAEQSIYLADMSGDGMTDIVRIRNGEICYWPNLGYGRFGKKITMRHSPRFDETGQFDQKRVRLADTDGSGTTDVLYLDGNEIRIYLNESGNGWSSARRLPMGVDDSDSVAVVDFLGRGTACLVWSSPLPSFARRPLMYVDLMHGQKPFLLTRSRNNLGAETVIDYASSTEFYLADKADGRPWITRLPFPVHVVSSVTTFDYVSRSRSVKRFTYHHGYFDSAEREFRGFGRVESTEAEELDVLNADQSSRWAANEDPAFNLPPVLTKQWFHTGAFLDASHISRHMAHEYYREPGGDAGLLLDDTLLPPYLSPEETREACRALKGSLLRQETYALDRSEEEGRPYSVTESNFTIVPMQRRGPNLHAVFFAHARESVSFNYERKLYKVGKEWRADPRTAHTFTLKVDGFGNTLEAVSVAYGRRFADAGGLLTDDDRRKQSQVLSTLTRSDYTNAIRERHAYRNPLSAETRTYELTRLPAGPGRLFRFEEVARWVAEARDLPHEETDGGDGAGPYRRLLTRGRNVYRSDDLTRLLPVGQMEARALGGEAYQLALTAGLIEKVFVRDGEALIADAQQTLGTEAGYRDLDGDGQWWVPSGRVFYAPQPEPAEQELQYAQRHFFMARRFVDPFGKVMNVRYDRHDLMPNETRDALGSTMTAQTDYRVLAPRQVTDLNGNRTEVLFDTLAMIAATAVRGKRGEGRGDSLEGVVADLPEHVVRAHFDHPLRDPLQILGNATTRMMYDLFAFMRTQGEQHPQPSGTYTLSRETHVSELAPGEKTKVQHGFSYSDGFGRVAQKKVQAEPDPLVTGPEHRRFRWAGTGWTIFNNKENPVRKYEPFFSDTHAFEYAKSAGVSATLFYDPLGRMIATLHPEHTYEKILFDPWRQETWDGNDTVLELDPAADPDVGGFFKLLAKQEYLPTWYEERLEGALGVEAQKAAKKASVHAGTPKIAYFDTLGRSFLSIEQNRFEREGVAVEERFATRSELDVQGRPRWITDALGRRIIAYDYDVNGGVLRQVSLDSGARWSLDEIAGKPLLAWDSRGYRLHYGYDLLRRQVTYHVQARGEANEKLAEQMVYGEGQPEDRKRNLRGVVFESRDAAGVITNVEFDFKGNLLFSTRQLLREYRQDVDWSTQPAFEEQVFTSRTSYDALNRPTSVTTPDASVLRPGYNEANLLDTVDVELRGAGTSTRFVQSMYYNAKGQRERIEYGNGTRTTYAYDPLTFRLAQLETKRERDGALLQDLHYTYDPSGNVSAIGDGAQETVYFNNEVVKASNEYVYDALYRLIGATGREHIGLQQEAGRSAHYSPDRDTWRRPQPLPSDGQAMRRYHEGYAYDAVGNLLEVVHGAAEARWRRKYDYAEGNNRLERTSIGEAEERYASDASGNMTRMPHLVRMEWDFKNQLHSTQSRVVEEGAGEKTYYVYNSGGQRVRKILERASGTRAHERVYMGGFELYREYEGEEIKLERETLHVMDDQRRLAMVETKTIDTKVSAEKLPSIHTRYEFSNHLDSACLELDQEGAILSYEEFYPYGSTSYAAVRRDVEISPKRYRYLGLERDEETGLDYAGARYYAAWLGRWTAPDPKGMVDGTNVYAYCRGNPIALRDPNGTDAETCSADEQAQACLVDTSIPQPTEQEQAEQRSISGDPSPGFIGPPAPPAPPAPAPPPAQPPAPPPPVDPPDNSLYVDHGVIWQQYTGALQEAGNSDNPLWARGLLGGLAILAAPLAGAEEYVGRPLTNVPWAVENGGIGIGEHAARAYLWAQQGETGEATVDALESVTSFSQGFTAAGSVAVPVSGALESSLARTSTAVVTTELEGDAVSAGVDLTSKGDTFGTYAKNAAPEPGFTDVSIHGDPKSFYVTPTSPAISHRTVATLIEGNPDYAGGPIRLLSCRTGAAGASAAQNLANKLGVEVMAPTDTLWAFPSGKLVIGPNASTATGTWRLFTPGVKP